MSITLGIVTVDSYVLQLNQKVGEVTVTQYWEEKTKQWIPTFPSNSSIFTRPRALEKAFIVELTT